MVWRKIVMIWRKVVKMLEKKKNSIIRLNIMARQDLPEFLTAHIYQYILSHWTMDKDWS